MTGRWSRPWAIENVSGVAVEVMMGWTASRRTGSWRNKRGPEKDLNFYSLVNYTTPQPTIIGAACTSNLG